MYVCVYVSFLVCMYVYMYHIYMCIHVHVNIYIHVCTCTYMYVQRHVCAAWKDELGFQPLVAQHGTVKECFDFQRMTPTGPTVGALTITECMIYIRNMGPPYW